jgi:hypothetical protein
MLLAKSHLQACVCNYRWRKPCAPGLNDSCNFVIVNISPRSARKAQSFPPICCSELTTWTPRSAAFGQKITICRRASNSTKRSINRGREDVDYILDTFPIVRRKDEAQHGEYRTKRVILEIYDAMQQAITTGQPYQTRLDPPPANGLTPPEMEEDRETGGRGEGETENGSASLESRLRREDARPQPGLFDKAE